MAPLNGLRNELAIKCRQTGILDIGSLQLSDVLTMIPGSELEINWQDVLYIKSGREFGKGAETIVWTETGGFFRTELTARKVINLRANTGAVCWLDMDAYKHYLEQDGTTLYVMGGLRLIPVGVQIGNQYSWLNCRTVKSVNNTVSSGKSTVLFDNGIVVSVNEKRGALKKRMARADEIFVKQQLYHQVATWHHEPEPRYERLRTVHEELGAMHLYRDAAFAAKLLKCIKYDLDESTILRIVKTIRHGDRLDAIE